MSGRPIEVIDSRPQVSVDSLDPEMFSKVLSGWKYEKAKDREGNQVYRFSEGELDDPLALNLRISKKAVQIAAKIDLDEGSRVGTPHIYVPGSSEILVNQNSIVFRTDKYQCSFFPSRRMANLSSVGDYGSKALEIKTIF